MAILLMFPLAALAQDKVDLDGIKEVLTLKHDLAQEKVLRIQAELVILKTQFQNGQVQLQALAKEIEGLNASLKALEVKKPKVEKEETK